MTDPDPAPTTIYGAMAAVLAADATELADEVPTPDRAPATAYGALAAVLAAIPQTLHHVRCERGLTMRDVADQVGVSISTIHRIENGYTLTPRYTGDLLRWLDGQAVTDD